MSTTIAVVTIGYRQFALDVTKATQLVTLLSQAAEVEGAYDRDAERREPEASSSYLHFKREDQSEISMKLHTGAIEKERRPALPDKEAPADLDDL